MKTDFKNSKHMMEYINKVFSRNTDLEKVCQYCGKPASIKYNQYGNPYSIQLVCRPCRGQKHPTNYNKMYTDIPEINLKEHFKQDKIEREEFKSLTEENRKKIESLLSTKLTKAEAIKSVGLTVHQYNVLVNKYEYEINAFIKIELKKVFNRNRDKILKDNAIKRNKCEYRNNLYRIKKERKLSNKDISNLTRGKISSQHISLISTDKVEPKIQTKCELAMALHLSVADIFPEDYLFNKIYNYAYYLEYVNKVANALKKYYEETNKLTISKFSYVTGISAFRLYDIMNKRNYPRHDEIVKLKEILKTF